MLTAIRERTQGWIAYVVVGLIVIVMALFGLYSYFEGPPPNEIAVVNGEEISLQQLDNVYRQQRQQLEQMFGGELDPRMFEERMLRRRALDQLIDETLLRQFVQAENFRVNNVALAAQIRAQEIFHEDGRFSPELYRVLLRNNGLTPQAYEASMRVQHALGQLQQGLGGSAFVTDWEASRLLALQNQERELSYLRIPAAAFEDEVSVSDEDIAQYYEANPEAFMRPEQVRLEYVMLDPDSIVSQLEVSEDELRTRYEALKDSRYTEDGQRRLRHILLSLPEDANQTQVEEARRQLQQWREQIAAGEVSFEALAEAESDDPGSATQGGDLGWVTPGIMVEPFEDAAFALEEGELSEPVRTDFGLHLIQAVEIEPAQVQSFEDVREELRREVAAERVQQEIIARANRLANLSYEEPDTLQPAADALGLEVQQTDWIPRQGGEEGLAAEPQVVEAAYARDVLESGYNSELIELDDGRRLVVRLAEHQQAEREPLEEVADEVRSRLLAERTQQMAQAQAEEINERLAEGQSLQTLVKEPFVLEQPGYVQRGTEGVPVAVLQRAFELPKPSSETGSSHDVVSLPGGDVFVLQVSDVRQGESEDAEAERDQILSGLAQMQGMADIESAVELLRTEADIEIYEDRL